MGRPYLNRQFFSLIGESMAEDILLIMAKRNGHYIAGAINFIGVTRSSAGTGAALKIIPTCILKFAIIRQSILPSIEN